MAILRATQPVQKNDASWWLDCLFITVVLGTLFFIFLGTRPLFVPDEGRYAEIAREMALSGDYVTPYLNGIKYFEKPALFYWLWAAAIKIGGLNLWAIRSVNALIGLLGCLLTYLTARKLYDRTTGLLAAFILGTSALYFVMAHMISLDLPVTVFIAASLYAFILGGQSPASVSRRPYMWSATAAAALAVLTKGLIGIVFPLMIIGVWITLLGEWRLLKKIYLPSCILLFLLITAPWHILVAMRHPEFSYFYFIEQHFLRYATVDVGHYQPVWFFIPCLILGLFPWIVFLPQSIAASWKRRASNKAELFFLLWAILIFAFFSFSKSKLIPYILPIFPPLAILTGRYLAVAIERKFTTGLQAGFICMTFFAVILAYAFHSFTHGTNLPDPELAQIYLRNAATILLIGSIGALLLVFKHRTQAIILTITTSWLFLVLIIASIPAIDARSIQPLANILLPIIQPNDEVITYNQYYQDLPFYLERKVSILNWRNELSYGIQHQAEHDWMIDDATFWQHWRSNKRVFVVLSSDEYSQIQKNYPKNRFYKIGETVNNVLITNKK